MTDSYFHPSWYAHSFKLLPHLFSQFHLGLIIICFLFIFISFLLGKICCSSNNWIPSLRLLFFYHFHILLVCSDSTTFSCCHLLYCCLNVDLLQLWCWYLTFMKIPLLPISSPVSTSWTSILFLVIFSPLFLVFKIYHL